MRSEGRHGNRNGGGATSAATGGLRVVWLTSFEFRMSLLSLIRLEQRLSPLVSRLHGIAW
jgi:hypothetical protein